MEKVKEVRLLFCIHLVLGKEEIVLNSRKSDWHFELERNQL